MRRFKFDYGDLKELQIFLYKKTGLYVEEKNFEYLKVKLDSRFKETHILSLRKYLELLKTDKREIQALIDELTINETYFMREIDSIDIYFDKVLNNHYKDFGKIKIVSAACSSGEEPYSIAILINEKYPYLKGKVEIKAFDIDSRVIKRAKKGIYRSFSLRAVDKVLVERYFEKKDGEYQLKDQIMGMVEFYNMNIFDPQVLNIMRASNLILSRNVLIYFGMEYKRKALDLFYDSLQNDGYLILGKSESIFNVNDKFEMVHYPNVILYRKEVKNGG